MTQRASGDHLVITRLPGETLAGRFSGNELSDLFVERSSQPVWAGSLFWGRVTKVDRALDAAFVDLALPQAGWLPLPEADKGLSEGSYLALQVTREASGDKGPRVTARLDPALRPYVVPADKPKLLHHAHSLAQWLALQPPLPLEDKGPWVERLESSISRLLQPAVSLPGGGHLLIEPVRTLTAIDVNAGDRRVKGGPEALALAVNLAAVPVIAREVRLRGLAGRVVIDFLSQHEPPARLQVTTALKAALSADPRPHRIGTLGASGLLEITRQRLGPPLHELLMRQVGEGGCGWQSSPETLAFRALRQARRLAPVSRLTITAAPEMLAHLTAMEARRAVEQSLGLTLVLQGNETWPLERFEVRGGIT